MGGAARTVARRPAPSVLRGVSPACDGQYIHGAWTRAKPGRLPVLQSAAGQLSDDLRREQHPYADARWRVGPPASGLVLQPGVTFESRQDLQETIRGLARRPGAGLLCCMFSK